MSIAFAPLSDITNVRRTQTNILASCALSPSVGRSSCETTALSPEHLSPFPLQNAEVFSSVYTASSTVHVTRTTHNPYGWKCLPDNETQATILLAQRAHDASHRATLRRIQLQVQAASANAAAAAAAAAAAQAQAQAQSAIPRPTHEVSMPIMVPMTQSAQPNQPLRCLVQFKCHHAEYSSTIMVEKGQYVAVQGDRGMDIGVVIRVNDGENKTFIERTGPCGSIMRHATQREVDYWASELKQDEANALEFCRRRCAAFDLQMEVRYAEFQYDKKKLTFYYDAKSRVNFVDLLKDLYREFGCRIWMEKVRPQNE